MSLAAMHWARQSLKTLPDSVKAPARLALMLLADYAGEDHTSWPSINTMALEMGCSSRSVQRTIELLAGHGLLVVEARYSDTGRQVSNRYRLAVDGAFKQGCQIDTPTISANSGGGDKLAPTEGDKLTEGGDTRVRGRVTPVSCLESTNKNLPLNPTLSDAGEPSDSFPELATRCDDQGNVPEALPRKHVMHLDWQPDPEQLAMACQRAGLPTDTTPAQHQLAKFTAHHADTGRTQSATAWHARLADWLRNDQRQQANQSNSLSGGDRHANRQQRTPARRITAAEARRRASEQAQHRGPDTRPVYDGEYAPADG